MLEKAQTRLRIKGRIATLVRAAKSHGCRHCGKVIPAGSSYYTVVPAGSGLGALKFPDRVHVECLDLYITGSMTCN